MIVYFFISVTGWIAALALGFETALPYLIRRTTFLRWAGDSRPYLERMQPHLFIGYGIAGLSFAHAFASMSGGRVTVGMPSLMAGTLCLALLLVQVLIGIALTNPPRGWRLQLRRIHFWMMTTVAALLAAHLWLR